MRGHPISLKSSAPCRRAACLNQACLVKGTALAPSRPPPTPLTGALATTDSKAARIPDPWTDLALPLLTATPWHRSKIIQSYLDLGGNFDAEQRSGDVAIGMAVDEGSEWAFDVLRTSGASLRFSADRPDFLIFAAAASRNLSLAQRLIEEFGFDVNASDTCGSTPYIVALGAGDVAMATLFTRLGADTTASTEDGRQAVHFAAAGGLVEWLRTFLVQRERDE